MSRPKIQTQIKEVEGRIRAHDFTLRYVDWCEDARTPGLLGQIRGVTDWERKEVKISLFANPLRCDLLDILTHELRHLDEPDWDCGNRAVYHAIIKGGA
jgi:hypothetical protein